MEPKKQPKIVIVLVILVCGIFAGWTYLRRDCGPNAGTNFREDFSYMTSTVEHCGAGRFNCDARLPHWQKPIVVSIYSEGIEDSQIDLVQAARSSRSDQCTLTREFESKNLAMADLRGRILPI